MIKKNQPATITFYDAAQSTSLTSPVVTLSKDGAAFATLYGVVVTSLGNGLFSLPLTAAQTNADVLTIRVTATGIEPIVIIINTDPNDYALESTSTTIKAKTDTIPANIMTTSSAITLSASDIATLKSGLATSTAVENIAATLSTVSTTVSTLNTNSVSSSDIPTTAAIAQAIFTTDLSSYASSNIPLYSEYTAILASLNSKVEAAGSSGTWVIKKPNGSVHATRTVVTSDTASPIVEVK